MNSRLFSFLAVSLVLVASSGGFLLERDEEPDGFPPLVVAMLVGGAIGGVGGWVIHDIVDSDSDQSQEYLRLASANNLTDVMSVATVFTANTNANYAQLWGMTKEHWIRQAELEAYSQWSSGRIYDSDSVLKGSAIYENNAVMTANAVAQIDSFMDRVSEKASRWVDEDTYAGKMSIGFMLDNHSITSSSGFDAKLISLAEGSGKVFIGSIGEESIVTSDTYEPSYLINFGPRTMVTGNGLTYAIEPGKTYIEDIYSTEGHRHLENGVYTISNATLGGDTLSSVIGGVQLRSAVYADIDGESGYAVLDGDAISCMGMRFGSLSFKVEASDIPEGTLNPDPVDLKPVLVAYQKLLDKLFWTTVSANNAARAIWDVYDRADEKQYGVTTLMASNVYESVVLSDSMNEILTLSAMQQLASYYDIHSDDLDDLKIGLYADGMDAPFVRGSIMDRYGNTVYDDVIFTPFFQSDDVTLERGTEYTVNQNTFVAVWHDGMELTAWYEGSMDTEGYETMFIEDGYTFLISQLGQCDSDGMHNQSSIEFRVAKVRYIDPGEVRLTDDIGFQRTAKNVLQAVCLIAGVLLVGFGVLRRDVLSIVLGIVLIVFAVVLADQVWAWIMGLRLW